MNSIPLLLVTGFLGAGKTAFLKRLIVRFVSEIRLYVIVNEFGKEGLDGALLADSGGKISEIAGGSIFCSCRMEHFETALQEATAFCKKNLFEKNSDDLDLCKKIATENRCENLIVVETSGFSDPSAIMSILSREQFAAIEYVGCLCLADAVFFEKVFSTARSVKRQLGIADAVLLNKSDLALQKQRQRIRDVLGQQYPNIPVFETVYGELPSNFFTDAFLSVPQGVDHKKDFDAFLSAIRFYVARRFLDGTDGTSFLPESAKTPLFQPKDITQQKMALHISPQMSVFDFEKCVRMFIEDTYRIKGIIQLAEGVFLANCVGNRFSLETYHAATSKVADMHDTKTANTNTLTVLAGSGMNLRRAVLQAVQWYAQYVHITED